MREAHTTLMNRVVGTACSESLVCAHIELPMPALDILEWRRTVLVDQADATYGGVLLQARLRTLCLYTTADYQLTPDPVGTENGTGVISQIAGGRLLSARTDIRFSRYLPMDGAAPGMHVRVVDAYVDGEASRLVQVDPGGLVEAVLDQSTVLIGVLVLAREQFDPHDAGREERISEQPKPKPKPKPKRKRASPKRRANRQRTAAKAGALPDSKMVRKKRGESFLWVDPTRQPLHPPFS